MLDTPRADNDTVLHRALVLIALVCSGLIVASFALFVRDQVSGASKHQQNALATRAPNPPPLTQVGHQKAQPRRFIDGAASTLTSPFTSIVQSDSQWVLHGLPTLFALLVYGGGIGYLARYSQGLS
jgi:hypothetical protein